MPFSIFKSVTNESETVRQFAMLIVNDNIWLVINFRGGAYLPGPKPVIFLSK